MNKTYQQLFTDSGWPNNGIRAAASTTTETGTKPKATLNLLL